MRVAALVLALASGLCSLAAIGLAWRGLFGEDARQEEARLTTYEELPHGRRLLGDAQRRGFGWAAGLGVAAAVLGIASAVASYLDG